MVAEFLVRLWHPIIWGSEFLPITGKEFQNGHVYKQTKLYTVNTWNDIKKICIFMILRDNHSQTANLKLKLGEGKNVPFLQPFV
jgi:hypothetical protein